MLDFVKRTLNGFRIVARSFRFMLRHRVLFSYPCALTLSAALVTLLILGSFYLFYARAIIKKIAVTGEPYGLAFLFACVLAALTVYYAIALLITFFSVAGSYATLRILEQKPVTFYTSKKHAFTRLNTIVQWGLFFAFAGFITSVTVDNTHEPDHEDNKQPQQGVKPLVTSVGSILDFAWELTTFFVFPVIAFERVHITTLLRHSLRLLKQTFGETIIARFGFGFINAVITLVALTFFLCIISLFQTPHALLATILLLIYMLIITFIMSCFGMAQTVFKTVVYAYAHDKPIAPFSAAFIKDNFVSA